MPTLKLALKFSESHDSIQFEGNFNKLICFFRGGGLGVEALGACIGTNGAVR